MAQLLRLHFAVLIGLLSLSLSATARPCRTFLISSYSFSLPSDQDNPSSSSSSSSATFATFTEIRSFVPLHISPVKPSFSDRIFVDLPVDNNNAVEIDHHRRAPFGFSPNDISSLRDRTKDILSVVVALLFGVGCGALTAATMYLAWSMFANRFEEHGSPYDYFLDDNNNDDDEKMSAQKIGYEKIPDAKEAV